jgi:hypothetical protein
MSSVFIGLVVVAVGGAGEPVAIGAARKASST